MSKPVCTNYSICVWYDGDVDISSRVGLDYAQVDGVSELCCGAERGTDRCKAVKSACANAANAMRALNDTLMALEEER